jgi:CelD/BcsL family acetyltransferase involved in cellulose biosynthesis
MLARRTDYALARPPGLDELRVEVCAFDSVPASWHWPWDRLALNAAEPNPYYERWFFEAGAAHLPPSGPTRLLSVWEGEELIGLLPLVVERHARIPVYFLRNWRHNQCFLGSPLIRAGRETDFWSEVLAMLDSAPWAKSYFHLNSVAEGGPVHLGLVEAASRLGRPSPIVHRRTRAMLASELGPAEYYEASVRKKKRKELKRQYARLAELGAVTCDTLGPDGDPAAWCDSFLKLESSGWKGRIGSALAMDPASAAFFRDAFLAAHRAERLEALALRLDGRPLAMLVNLIAPPGAFSFKTAIDEDYARFSPGVLLQIENLRLLDRDSIDWTDSCAVENHSMINTLWSEERRIVRVSVPLAGARRRAIFTATQWLETGSALVRRLEIGFRQPWGA